MGKNKGRGSLPHREAYQRMNFLHQASEYLMAAKGKSGGERSVTELSRHYNVVMKTVARRLVLRIDRSIKRGVCKCCHSSLVVGDTSRVRVRGNRRKHAVVTCATCGAVRRYYAILETAGDAKDDSKKTKSDTTATE